MRWIVSFTLVRLVVLTLFVGAVWACGQIGAEAATLLVPQTIRGPVFFAAALAAAALMIFAYRFAVRLIERRSPVELDRGRLAAGVLFGAGIGAVLIVSVYIVLFAVSVARWNGLGTPAGLLAILTLSLLAAVNEEILFRGVIFRVIEDGFGTLAAVIVSALLFGGVHAWNPGASIVSSAAVALEAGVMLGLAYAGGRTLWLPIGIHFGWNFTEGAVLGAPISGFDLKGLLDIRLTGSDLLTGGAFGPEASIVAVAVCLAAAFLFGTAAARTGEWKGIRAEWSQPRGSRRPLPQRGWS
jgi:membrane protease YdiL (CAAX protease family)